MSLGSLMMAGIGMQAASALMQAKAQSVAAKFNAELAQRQAEEMRARGELEKYRINRQKRRLLGRQRALYAKVGVRYDEGSPLEVLADTAAQFELDKAISDYNTQAGIGYYTTKAALNRYAARQARYSGLAKAGMTLLTGGLNMYEDGFLNANQKKYGFEYWKKRGLASTPEEFGISSSIYAPKGL